MNLSFQAFTRSSLLSAAGGVLLVCGLGMSACSDSSDASGPSSNANGGTGGHTSGAGGSSAAASGSSATGGTSASPAAHWEYEGEDGPDHWAELSQDYGTCESGKKQSPIELPASAAPGNLEGLQFSYTRTPVAILDNGHTVQVNFSESANKLHVAGKDYTLAQFHFHAHAEHTRAGLEPSPLELHLVHKAEDGSLAVVGVLFKVGAHNEALDEVFKAMPNATATAASLADSLDPTALLPADTAGWAYSGSLTTPPCSEGVNWHVYATELEVSEEQLAAFTAAHAHSYRPTMAINDRIISGGDFPHFDYEGEEGPEHWGDLSPGTAACKTGHQQSPIDIPSEDAPAELQGLELSYESTPAKVFDNGHTVQFNLASSNNKITLAGKPYSLLQFHFHKHSEHTLAGEAMPLEVHFVHKAADGALAVLGVLFENGEENAAFAKVFDSMAEATDVPSTLPFEINPADLLPTEQVGWSYAGSLTTPPCSEGVQWIVYSKLEQVSDAQLAAFKYAPSYRPTQTIFERLVQSGI